MGFTVCLVITKHAWLLWLGHRCVTRDKVGSSKYVCSCRGAARFASCLLCYFGLLISACFERALAVVITGRVELDIKTWVLVLFTCVFVIFGGLTVLGVLYGGETMCGF